MDIGESKGIFEAQCRARVEEYSFMNRPVGVCIIQISRNPRISSAYKLYAFYYFYIVVICLRKKKKKIKKKKMSK
jgi:hypothetical protein